MKHKKIRGLPLAHKKKVVKHLKGDIKTFKHEAKEDRELIKSLKHKRHEKHESKKHEKKEHAKKYSKKAEKKISKVMHEYGEGKLHSGSKKGPKVSNPKQAVAIAISEAKRKGFKVPKRKKK